MNKNSNLFENTENEFTVNDKENLEEIKGLKLIENFISPEEEEELISNIDNHEWMTDLKRRVQHYGYKYDYRARRINVDMKIGDLPNWGVKIADQLFETGIFRKPPDQLIVNEYLPGQGISPHIDCEPCFEDTIVSISLNSTAIMNFIHVESNRKIEVLLNRRSAVILKEASRYQWKHSIIGRKTDKFNNKVIPRNRRISLTFRNVILEDHESSMPAKKNQRNIEYTEYSNEQIKLVFNSGQNLEFCFFWGHTPKIIGEVDKSCLSQWFERKFEYRGIQYLTAEHWMMAEKAKLFNDDLSLEKILNCSSPKEAKSIGRKVKDFDEVVWNRNKARIVKNGNYLKFKQNEDLWGFLDNTKNKILVESSPYDKIWGIGMRSKDMGVKNPNNWKGYNLLGYALMEVRDKLRIEKMNK